MTEPLHERIEMSSPLPPAGAVAVSAASADLLGERAPAARLWRVALPWRTPGARPRLSGLLQDVRSTFRGVRRWPAGYVVIVLTLALGIGINTMFFTFFNGMVLRPLPFADPERLVTLNESQPALQQTQGAVSAANLRDWQEENTVFGAIAPFVQLTFDLHSNDEPERLRGAAISAALFPMLGVHPVVGRHLLPEEDRPGARPVAIISHAVWQRRFNADPGVLSHTIYLNDRPYEIVGVMPAGFKFPHFAEVWTPLALDPNDTQRDRRHLEVIARLAPGVTAARAQSEMTAIAARLAERYPGSNEGWSVRLRRLRDAWLPPVTRFSALAQQVQVAFVLLIACANVANLMLARAAARRNEIALRSALGASRRRLVRQFLTEGIVLAIAGGAVGTAVAVWGDTWLRALVQIPIPYWLRFEFDRTAFLFALAVTIVAGIGFSLVPALRYSGPNLVDALKAGGRTGEATSGSRLRRVLVIAQFVMSAILLVGALLMITSFLRVTHAPAGYRSDRVLTLRLSLNGEQYRDPQRRALFLNKAAEQIGGLPAVVSAGAANYLPASSAGYDAVQIDVDGQMRARGERKIATRQAVTGGFLDTLGIPLLAGRQFSPAEIDAGGDIVIIGGRLARQLWPGETALGHRIRVIQGQQPGPWLTIIGTAGDIQPPYQVSGLDSWPRDQLYVPYASNPVRIASIAIQTRSDPAAVAPDVRSALRRMDATVPVYDVYTMTQVQDLANWIPRLWGQLFSVFGILAVLMAAAGTYSATMYAVSRRTHEIGIRMAVGARPAQILQSVLRDALAVCGIGTLVGMALALPMGLFLGRLLYGVNAFDPVIFGGVALILTTVCVAAAYLPAHRAARVHPTVALRTE